MENNSIRCRLTKEDIVSEIKLLIGSDLKKELTFIIVEGLDDIKFWKKFITNKAFIYESFSAKTGIKEIIETYFDDNPQVIGIRDKDYEQTRVHPKIFYYDYSCLELMLVNNFPTFEGIYSEYYNGPLNAYNLRETILSELKFLSLVRKNNEINHWGITIDCISIYKVFDNASYKIIIDRIIEKLNAVNHNFFINFSDRLTLIYNEFDIDFTYTDLLNITQGHDYVSLFAAFCQNSIGKCYSDTAISCSLRSSYRIGDFYNSNLYNELKIYEINNSLNILE